MVLLGATLFLLAGLGSGIPNPASSDPPYSDHSLHLDREARSFGADSLRRRSSTAQVYSTDGNNQFSTNIKFGSESFKVVIDTGSSDTWLAGNGFQCLNPNNGKDVNIAECGFANLYKYKDDSTRHQTSQEADENFLVTYTGGPALTGILANDRITLAGLTFETEIGIAQKGYWDGDGTTSGLVGLAFPALTSAFSGTNPSYDSDGNRITYASILYQLFVDNGYKPAMFSMALSRDTSQQSYGGTLTIGGIPDLSNPRINAKPNTWTYTDLVKTPLVSQQDYSYYTILVDTVTWGSGSSQGHETNGAQRYAVDSGTSLIYVPTNVAKAYNNLWDQPTTHDIKQGIWSVPCDAIPPPFSVTINGKVFEINPVDLIQPNENDCVSAIVDVGNAPPLTLGDVFLKNVVAVFDWENVRMGFTPRTKYES